MRRWPDSTRTAGEGSLSSSRAPSRFGTAHAMVVRSISAFFIAWTGSACIRQAVVRLVNGDVPPRIRPIQKYSCEMRLRSGCAPGSGRHRPPARGTLGNQRGWDVSDSSRCPNEDDRVGDQFIWLHDAPVAAGRVQHRSAAQGRRVSPTDVDDAVRFQRLSLDVMKSGDGWEKFAEAQTAARGTKWWPAYPGSSTGYSSLESIQWQWDHVTASIRFQLYDPSPARFSGFSADWTHRLLDAPRPRTCDESWLKRETRTSRSGCSSVRIIHSWMRKLAGMPRFRVSRGPCPGCSTRSALG